MKLFKTFSNMVYIMGCVVVLALSFMCLFGSKEMVNPEAMLPHSWREQAFYWLAFGSVPMLAACFSVWVSNRIYQQSNNILKFFLVFIPGIICSGCALFTIGVILYGFIINWPPGI